MFTLNTLALSLLIAAISTNALAVEVAPRISDREIIEALTELKAGQRALAEQMDQRFSAIQAQMDQRFSAMQAQMDQRFATVDQHFTAVDQRFDSLEKRLDFIQNLLLALIAGVFGLIGFVVWDRYSTLRPMDLRIRRLEEDLERDLELKSPEGSRLTRLIHALRELAKTDQRIEAILKEFHLL